jgi:DNA-directed RNA polymerase subunit RPC12/RpoP
MSSMGPRKTPKAHFVIEAVREHSYRYICGNCGAPLSDHGTRQLLDCIFLCSACGTANDAPVTLSQTSSQVGAGPQDTETADKNYRIVIESAGDGMEPPCEGTRVTQCENPVSTSLENAL